VTSEPDSADAVAPADALAAVRARIAAAARRAGRAPEEVTLVGVSKTVPLERVVAMAEAGLEDLGENHAVEMHRKAEALPNVRWHFLGKLQRGTVRHVADVASVVHSGEPGGALEALVRRVGGAGRTLDVLTQVDFAGQRQGVDPAGLETFLEELHAMAGLRAIGLMTLPPLTATPEEARPYFERLRTMRNGLVERWPALVELSMGMSGDYEVAVEEGATMVRVGTALFGRRPLKG
jgi:hypothetical protein